MKTKESETSSPRSFSTTDSLNQGKYRGIIAVAMMVVIMLVIVLENRLSCHKRKVKFDAAQQYSTEVTVVSKQAISQRKSRSAYYVAFSFSGDNPDVRFAVNAGNYRYFFEGDEGLLYYRLDAATRYFDQFIKNDGTEITRIADPYLFEAYLAAIVFGSLSVLMLSLWLYTRFNARMVNGLPDLTTKATLTKKDTYIKVGSRGSRRNAYRLSFTLEDQAVWAVEDVPFQFYHRIKGTYHEGTLVYKETKRKRIYLVDFKPAYLNKD